MHVRRSIGSWLGPAILGFVLGVLLFDTRRETESLRTQLNSARAELRAAKARWHPSVVSSPVASRPVPPPRVSSAGPALTLPAGITQEDLESTRAMDEGAQHGDYLLEYERPAKDKLRRAAARGLAARFASSNLVRLDALFGQLSITPETRRDCRSSSKRSLKRPYWPKRRYRNS